MTRNKPQRKGVPDLGGDGHRPAVAKTGGGKGGGKGAHHRAPRPRKNIGPSPRQVLCRGCDEMVGVLFPVCDGCVAELPEHLRNRLIAVHQTPNIAMRLYTQDVVRGFFRAQSGRSRITTPTVSQPTVYTSDGDRAWID
jgi:hypothetical protein